jgi:hypothetical protein
MDRAGFYGQPRLAAISCASSSRLLTDADRIQLRFITSLPSHLIVGTLDVGR